MVGISKNKMLALGSISFFKMFHVFQKKFSWYLTSCNALLGHGPIILGMPQPLGVILHLIFNILEMIKCIWDSKKHATRLIGKTFANFISLLMSSCDPHMVGVGGDGLTYRWAKGINYSNSQTHAHTTLRIDMKPWDILLHELSCFHGIY
jgi:hypothetical protein